MPLGGTADPAGGGRGQRGGPDSGGRGGRGGPGGSTGVGSIESSGPLGGKGRSRPSAGSARGDATGAEGRGGTDVDSTGSFLEGIVSKAISGLASIAGTAIAGPFGGIAAGAGMEALLGGDIGLGDLGIDLGEPGPTNVGARRSPVPGTDRDQAGSLLGRAIGPGGETQPQGTPSAGVNTTTGQGGVARGSTQVSGRTGQVPASRSLLSSLATTSRKSLLGV